MLSLLHRCLLPVFLFVTGSAAAQSGTPTVPASMLIELTIAASPDGKTVPLETDTVTVVNRNSGAEETTAPVDQGAATIILSRTSTFNGTVLLLRIKRNGTSFALIDATGAEATFTFNGSFLPVRQPMSVALANSTSSGGNNGGGNNGGGNNGGGNNGGGSGSLTGDINGDGVIDQRDVVLLKDAISGRAKLDSAKMDINADSVVNTRDLIDLIRAVRGGSRPKPGSALQAVRQ